MSSPPNVFNASTPSAADEEDRMRQALGLRNGNRGEIAQQRHDQPRRGRHFVRDGEVPVVVLSNNRDHGGENGAPTNRFEAAETARRAEQAARERAERALHDAQETIQQLKTKLAHAEMAHNEAIAAERARTAGAESAMRAAIDERVSLEARVGDLRSENRALLARAERLEARAEALRAERVEALRAERIEVRPVRAERPPVESIAPVARRKPGPKPRQPVAVDLADEQEPVKWWLPSTKVKSR